MVNISPAFAAGTLVLACITTSVILYLEAKYDRPRNEMASITYMMVWLFAVILVVSVLIGV